MGAKEIRYTVKRSDNCAEARMAKCYQDGTYGKSPFISDCLSVGFIMKETGFTDLLKMLDADPSFHALSAMAKRERVISTIAGQRPAAEPVVPSQQASKQPAEIAPAEQPKPKTALPNLGS
jgi:hypothetical protein